MTITITLNISSPHSLKPVTDSAVHHILKNWNHFKDSYHFQIYPEETNNGKLYPGQFVAEIWQDGTTELQDLRKN